MIMNNYFMLLELFQYDFMIRALVAGVVLACIAPMIGIFLVTRHYSYLADTLAHVSLLGVALGTLMHIEPMVGSVLTAVVAAFGMEWLRQKQQLWSEAVLSLFLSGSLAVAVVLLSAVRGLTVNLLSILFGSLTTVSTTDVITIVVAGSLTGLIMLFIHHRLFVVAYGEQLAVAEGLPVKRLNTIFLVLSAITVALSLRTVGVLLVGALMVIPVLTALNLGFGFYRTLRYGMAFSVAAVCLGLYLSFFLGLATGGTIVLVALTIFVLTLPLRFLKK
jgi:zinc transport system permease protein